MGLPDPIAEVYETKVLGSFIPEMRAAEGRVAEGGGGGDEFWLGF